MYPSVEWLKYLPHLIDVWCIFREMGFVPQLVTDGMVVVVFLDIMSYLLLLQ